MPPQPHPQAAMPPGKPQRRRSIKVDAATVDAWLKQHGLDLHIEDGWQGTDGMHCIQVHRTADGGVDFVIED